ncbi:Letm1 RBD domain-containing protein [Mycena kentingensis (nom. inval.)]|nr:Letm1 RBD domain-containing protein [Mycena kentingensis (nom. inval.)]
MLMLAFRVHSNSRILGRRLLQTLPTQTQPDAPPPPSAPSRKQPVQLHPAPVKPPPKTATSTPRPPPPVQTESTVSLKAIKETTSRDIADAEAHGILEPPPADAGWAKSTLHKGIQLAKFYFRGVKLVYTRSGIARDIRLRIANGGSPLERWEHRMLHTQSADLKKIVPFVVTALIIEELIPLIIIWAPRSLPSTCILPSQRERILEKAADEAVNVVTRHGDVLGALARAATDERQIPLDTLKGEDRAKAVCGLLGISTMGPDFLRLRRIQKHLSFIQEDDGFLSRDSRNMSASDLAQALRERGIVPRGLDSAQQTQKLAWWLKSVNAPSTDSIARRVFLVTLLGSR